MMLAYDGTMELSDPYDESKSWNVPVQQRGAQQCTGETCSPGEYAMNLDYSKETGYPSSSMHSTFSINPLYIFSNCISHVKGGVPSTILNGESRVWRKEGHYLHMFELTMAWHTELVGALDAIWNLM